MKDNDVPVKIYLKDYRAPSHWIRKTSLDFQIFDEYTLVDAVLVLEKNTDSAETDLHLDGQQLELEKVVLDGVELGIGDYRLTDTQLMLSGLDGNHVLALRTRIYPQNNTSLEGLYKSRLMFCTQCEAEGFRKITYFLDRPDVMSEFTTRISADKEKYPVLLSNGNKIESGEETNGRHWASWHDPHVKPCYLFALVAGDLKHLDDTFVTASGREVLIRIFVEEKDLDKCDHAICSLKNAMRWDEETYDREYDLDIFMIVAVDDFNMGAMENKGLNIFNTSCVLANPFTTTDAEFQRVEGVVAHEYFHNWSGNRVTCRDWFQLSLKEGFTVFRDSEFSADMGSRTVKRVEDVSLLRSLQFSEDAGPMAHPVRPDAFIEISNFYTLTIYEKGAEVVRMIHTLLGPELFRQGTDLYFERHDGSAVTIEDFISCMAEVSGRDFDQFMLWYRQAGTPELAVSTDYCAESNLYTMSFKQYCRPTPECKHKKDFLIPVKLSLLGENGKLPVVPVDSTVSPNVNDEIVLELQHEEQTYVFKDLHERPVPSLLRGFSAPVKLKYNYSDADLLRVIRSDDDGYCRWDASQQFAIREIQRVMKCLVNEPSPKISQALVDAYSLLLHDEKLDKAMVALMLTLPSEKYLGELNMAIDVESIHYARQCVERKLAVALKQDLIKVYKNCLSNEPYSVDAGAIAKRSLKNRALHYLAIEGSDESLQILKDQYENASNMTDELAAFRAIVHSTKHVLNDYKLQALERFYQKWKHEPLVVNHWLSVQATTPLPQALDNVIKLMDHESFDFKNPNKLRSLVGAFCNANVINFHVASGRGYQFLADQVIALNEMNPQIASRMLTPLTKWQRYDDKRADLMKRVLEDIAALENLSKDVYEVISKTLAK